MAHPERTTEDHMGPPGPAVDVGSPRLSLAEVKQLWWFFDGAIMNVGVRHHLWRSWGLCPRHAWAHGAAECELRYKPFGTSILHEDLTRRAAQAAGRKPKQPTVARRFASRDVCFTCDYTSISRDGDPSFRSHQDRVNGFERTRRYFIDTRDAWESRSCPLCLGGHGLVCRQHLLQGVDPPTDLRPQLFALSDRLYAFVKSMTWGGKPVGPLENASWIESLGWFAGWDYPRKVSS